MIELSKLKFVLLYVVATRLYMICSLSFPS